MDAFNDGRANAYATRHRICITLRPTKKRKPVMSPQGCHDRNQASALVMCP